MIIATYRAINCDPSIKARAYTLAAQMNADASCRGAPERYVVEYRDRYNDYSIVGDYIVKQR